MFYNSRFFTNGISKKQIGLIANLLKTDAYNILLTTTNILNTSTGLANVTDITTSPAPSNYLFNNIGLFYGGSYGNGSLNQLTRIDGTGSLVGSETIVGTARIDLAGCNLNNNGIFYGGYIDANITTVNKITIITSYGDILGAEVTAGTDRGGLAGTNVDSIGLFYGGYNNTSQCLDVVTLLNNDGSLVGSETNVGSGRYALAGVGLINKTGLTTTNIGLFYGGSDNSNNPLNIITFINSAGVLVGSETNTGLARSGLDGASVGGVGLFFGGYNSNTDINYNTVTRISSSGTLVDSETTAGTARNTPSGADVNSNGMFYGGNLGSTDNYFNIVSTIDKDGLLVGSETNVGTARTNLAGVGLNT